MRGGGLRGSVPASDAPPTPALELSPKTDGVDSVFEELPTVEIADRDLDMERIVQGGVCHDIYLVKLEPKLVLQGQERGFSAVAKLAIGLGIEYDARHRPLPVVRHHYSGGT
jgi:hypothetical protein